MFWFLSDDIIAVQISGDRVVQRELIDIRQQRLADQLPDKMV